MEFIVEKGSLVVSAMRILGLPFPKGQLIEYKKKIGIWAMKEMKSDMEIGSGDGPFGHLNSSDSVCSYSTKPTRKLAKRRKSNMAIADRILPVIMLSWSARYESLVANHVNKSVS
ncbi:hypothetical protein HYC85_005966 [Camellia sinensis]|uniref:Uncharacterized protein n=1 Tax=Camellia sinensis TaxID=4442 RepID=A0A7J7I2G6_CAMSI|nr:hypothetical protein HYC85_005966 [Camellia sinensis]